MKLGTDAGELDSELDRGLVLGAQLRNHDLDLE